MNLTLTPTSAPARSTADILPLFGDMKPRPGQHEGIAWLRSVKRFALWDSPGYGKMLELAYAAVPPALVVAPAHLCLKWEQWLKAHLPTPYSEHVHLCTGTNMCWADRVHALADTYNDPYAFWIVNPEMLRYETDTNESGNKVTKYAHGEKLWEYPIPISQSVLIDEAHYLRGRRAVKSKGAADLFKRTPYVYQATATPIYREADDLYQQLHILRPDVFSSYTTFERMYLKTWNDGWSKQVIGVSNVQALLNSLRNFAIGRTYDEGLPEHIESEPIVVEPSQAFIKAMTALRNSYREGSLLFLTASAAVTEIKRRISANPEKLTALTNTVLDNYKRMDGTYRPVLVLVWMKETAQLVAAHLRQNTELPWTVIDGTVPAHKRETLARQSKGIVATLDSIDTGLDFSHVRIVARYEIGQAMPGKTYQGLSRVLRFRPEDDQAHPNEPVVSFDFILAKTGDAAMHRTDARREGNMTKVLGEIIQSND